MELKAISGDRDLYDVLKKQKKRQKKMEKKACETYVKSKMAPSDSTFDFINKKLSGHKGELGFEYMWYFDILNRVTTTVIN